MELDFNPYLAFAWSLLAGFIMSMGAGGGGILAGIGHISILGIGDPNLIKVVNQILEFASRLLSVPLYHRQKRLVWPLAAAFSIGAPFGAIAGAWASTTYLSDMNDYRPVFGVLVVVVAARVLYESWSKSAYRGDRAKRAYEASERLRRNNLRPQSVGAAAPENCDPPRTIHIGLKEIRIAFAGDVFGFSPILTAAGAFGISFLGALVGVGGGFLVTPFMATILLLPMYLVVGTGLVALMIPLAVAVLAYLAMQVEMNWMLVAVEVPAVMLGSILGPVLNRFMNEKLLKLYVAIVLFAIGIYYLF